MPGVLNSGVKVLHHRAGDLVFPVRGLDARVAAYREQAFAVERVHVSMDVALDEARCGDAVVAWVVEKPENGTHSREKSSNAPGGVNKEDCRGWVGRVGRDTDTSYRAIERCPVCPASTPTVLAGQSKTCAIERWRRRQRTAGYSCLRKAGQSCAAMA